MKHLHVFDSTVFSKDKLIGINPRHQFISLSRTSAEQSNKKQQKKNLPIRRLTFRVCGAS